MANNWPVVKPGTTYYVLAEAGGVVEINAVQITNTDSPYTPSNGMYVEADATSGAITVLLSSPGDTNDRIWVKKMDSSANVVTVDGNGTTIDGMTTFPLYLQYDAVTLVRTNNEWSIE